MIKFILFSKAARMVSGVKRYRRELVRYGALHLFDNYKFYFQWNEPK